MVEAESLSNVTPRLRTVSDGGDAMIKDGRREETSNFAALFWYTYNDEICFVGIRPKFIVCPPARDITETVTKLFKGTISVCCR